MSKAEAKINGKQIQYMQVQRRALGISDEVYKEMKRSVGVESTRDLTFQQMDELLKRMNGAILRRSSRTRLTCPGGKIPAEKRPASYKPVHSSAFASGMHHKPAADREALIAKIEAILTEFRLPWSYADSIVKQQTGGRIKFLRFCDADQTRKVLQALCVYQERQMAKQNKTAAAEIEAEAPDAKEVQIGDLAFYIKELRSEQCQCGKKKGSGKSFCYGCWEMLPPRLQRPLYQRLGEGYEAAYEAAVIELDKVRHQYE